MSSHLENRKFTEKISYLFLACWELKKSVNSAQLNFKRNPLLENLVALTFSLFCIGELKKSITSVTELAICYSRLEAEHDQFCKSHARDLTSRYLGDSNQEFSGSEVESISEFGGGIITESSLGSDQKSNTTIGHQKAKNAVCKNWQLNSRILQTGCFFRIKNLVSKP